MKNIPSKIKSFFKGIINNFKSAVRLIPYILLILVYSALALVRLISRKVKFLAPIEKKLYGLLVKLDNSKPETISRVELIHLAMQNMKSKRNRTVVTVGGMMVGIAAIVFLVSIAYGLQTLVVNRVARLDELRQADITTQPGSNLVIDDDVLESFKKYPEVEMVLPQIAVVGKVNFNNSATDMAVYGVTKDYLEQSAIAPVTGKSFDSNETATDLKAKEEVTELDSSEVTEEQLVGNWVEVEGESDTGSKILISKVVFPEEIEDKEAVVNRSFLQVLNIKESEAVGKKFTVSFVATSKSLLEDQNRIESTQTEYTIIGVTPDDVTPLFYVPFVHLRSLGITHFSQAKLVIDSEENLAKVREGIGAQGYSTSSVADTVEQIDSLFATARMVLALLGTVALFVAALGMFNTLTVSLLERTREVGLLKAMGMKSLEIRDLFLAESMIMGTLGGLLGLIGGLIVGKILELGLSIYAIANGAGSLTVVDIPFFFAVFIVFLSFLVGVFTGIYPARRATKISALNALRYE